MKVKSIKSILLVLPLLMSCGGAESSSADTSSNSDPSSVSDSQTSSEDSVEESSPDESSEDSSSEESSVEESSSDAGSNITVDAYVSAVSNTAPIMIAGSYNGESVDYVVSSYPVVYNASRQNNSLSVYANVAQEYGNLYGTNGFPQAGLFIRTDLENDATQADNISDFLATFDSDVADIISGASNTASLMDSYSTDEEVQSTRFGFNKTTLQACQENNLLSFISAENNPSISDFEAFSNLGYSVSSDQLSSYYPSNASVSNSEDASYSFSVTSPAGAPAAAFARYASNDNVTIASDTSLVRAAFTAAESDFIVFDSSNGLKLAGDNYKLVRMVTFGNLYVVSTGNDDDGVMDNDDYIVSYGEGLIPDLAFKAVYAAE